MASQLVKLLVMVVIVVVLPLATHARQLVKICTDSASRGLDLPAVRVVVFVLDVEVALNLLKVL